MRRFAFAGLAGGVCFLSLVGAPPSPTGEYNPPVKAASEEGQKNIARFKRDANLKVELWAAEPMLAQPVCFAFDEKGRCFVGETFRHSAGANDNRSHMNTLDDELASRSVADRVALYKRDAKDKFAKQYETERDRIRLLVDETGSGIASKSTVYSDDFGRAEDGIGAGLLARKGTVYYTCIPDLWKLTGTTADGKAEQKQSLATGMGVHTAFIGHDSHGLRIGPDGKLYFSIGDRGLNITTKEGKHLFHPDTGAVLRCDLDGSNLEVVATGLRNPQELAFDDHGNLFTVDNNSDSGDKARFVHIVEGGDSGWRIGYQYGSAMGNRGPWNSEKLWYPNFAGQAAYVLPPRQNFADGPSGFTHYPGIGLSSDFNDRFFLCDFRGGSANSGVWSFGTKANGASFDLDTPKQFLWSILATDCDFGPDSALYVSDWVEGWNKNGKGRMYKVTDPAAAKNPQVAEAKALLADDLTKRPAKGNGELLAFPHQQVRLEAQFALASQADGVPVLIAAATTGKGLARLHGIWGLGMAKAGVEPLTKLLTDDDAEIRAQAAKTLAVVSPTEGTARKLLPLLADASPRVRLYAALALAKTAAPKAEATTAALGLLKANAGVDPYLRHAGMMLLTAFLDPKATLSPTLTTPEKMGVVVALRRQGAGEALTSFLADADPLVVSEAARAINDESLSSAYAKLAALLGKNGLPEPAAFRALNARYLLGTAADAKAVAEYAARSDVPDVLRITAIKMLGTWATPPRRDYVTGLTMKLANRPKEIAETALRARLGGIFAGSAKVQTEAAAVASKLGINEVMPFLAAMVSNESAASDSRVEALQALSRLKGANVEPSALAAMASKDAKLRNAGRAARIKTAPKEVLSSLEAVLAGKDVLEQQGAFGVLAAFRTADADKLLTSAMDRWSSIPPEAQLDLLEAAKERKLQTKLDAYAATLNKGDDLAAFRPALVGGDAANGKRIFLQNTAVQCQRCHKVDGEGGEVGPVLNGIGAKQKRDYLLESIVYPNKQIAKGYDGVQITTLDGKTITGILRSEDAETVKLITPEGVNITVKKADIEERRAGTSGMPEDIVTKLTKGEIRDLVEFLAGLKEERKGH